MTEEEILDKITKLADVMGYDLNNNAIKIAKIKARQPDWRTCCCDPKNVHRYCGSRLCEDDTDGEGHCHCSLFLKRK